MKKLFAVFSLLAALRCSAADGVAAFQAGLQAFESNGPTALLNTWYDSREDFEKVRTLHEGLAKISSKLGPVIDTQVFAPHSLGRHVQKLYGVIYFEKRPLWLRAEYYSINGRSGFISLEWSLVPDDILPLTWAPHPGK